MHSAIRAWPSKTVSSQILEYRARPSISGVNLVLLVCRWCTSMWFGCPCPACGPQGRVSLWCGAQTACSSRQLLLAGRRPQYIFVTRLSRVARKATSAVEMPMALLRTLGCARASRRTVAAARAGTPATCRRQRPRTFGRTRTEVFVDAPRRALCTPLVRARSSVGEGCFPSSSGGRRPSAAVDHPPRRLPAVVRLMRCGACF